MPWRKRSRLLDKLIARMEEEEKPLQSMHILGVIELVSERIWASVRIVLLACFFLFVLLIGLEIQIQARNRTIGDLRQTVHDTKLIINSAIDPNSSGAKASADAELRIRAIEYKLCGGPCPPPPDSGGK